MVFFCSYQFSVRKRHFKSFVDDSNIFNWQLFSLVFSLTNYAKHSNDAKDVHQTTNNIQRRQSTFTYTKPSHIHSSSSVHDTFRLLSICQWFSFYENYTFFFFHTSLSLSFCLCLHWTTFGLLVKRFNFEQNIQQQHSYPCNKDTWSCATFPPEFNVIITLIHVFLRGVTGDISTKDDKNENHRSSPPLSPPPTNIINLFCKSNKRNRRDFSQKNQLVFIIVSEILYNPQFEFSSSVNF